jgi:hypothetical protein
MLALPAGASAATTIGQIATGAPISACVGTSYWVQDTSGGPSYAVPSSGVITSWQHKANSTAGRELGLRVFRLVSGTTYTLVGSSGVEVLTPSSINSFSARIPVQAGDRLGLYVGNPGTIFPFDPGGGADCAFTGGAGDLIHEGSANPEVATGATASLTTPFAAIYRLNVAATVEADADGDGFGDETQDACPTKAGAQGGCPVVNTPAKDSTPPRVTVATRRASVKHGKVALKVTTDEPAGGTVTGTVSVPSFAKVYRLKRATASMALYKGKTISLVIPKRALKPIRRALERHRKLKARLTLNLKDAAGNATVTKATVALRR